MSAPRPYATVPRTYRAFTIERVGRRWYFQRQPGWTRMEAATLAEAEATIDEWYQARRPRLAEPPAEPVPVRVVAPPARLLARLAYLLWALYQLPLRLLALVFWGTALWVLGVIAHWW